MAFERWKKSLANCSAPPQSKILYVHGRMVIGLGSDSILETGLTLHHTYGTPMIPGSALKGLAAHYCDQVWGAADENKEFRAPEDTDEEAKDTQSEIGKWYRVIFGTQKAAGYFTFHDAWITPESLDKEPLCLDVMTPHHSKYYGGEDVPPSDFDDPKPISFLSVRGCFHFAVSCEIPGTEGENWCKLVLDLLKQALENWGIGAKTSSGYGRMGEKPLDPPHVAETTDHDQVEIHVAKGDRIKVKRIERKGKKGLWFEAEDGTKCQVLQVDDPSKGVRIGEETELWVVNAAQGIYTLSSTKPKEKSKPKKGPRR
jgi:CRISPR-associated protein Cmr6